MRLVLLSSFCPSLRISAEMKYCKDIYHICPDYIKNSKRKTLDDSHSDLFLNCPELSGF